MQNENMLDELKSLTFEKLDFIGDTKLMEDINKMAVRAFRDRNYEALKEFCNKGLPEYKCPEAFYFKTLPKTSTGKIRKNILLADILPDTLERKNLNGH